MTSGREIYWISAAVTPAMQEKIDILRKMKVEVKLLPDFHALARTYPAARLNTIVIDDSMIDSRTSDQIGRLTSHPEYAGVRFILSLTQAHSSVTNWIVSLGFRDIISIDLNQEQWLRRYSFASSGQAADMAEPYPQITMKSISALHIPARIAWINHKELWLESRITPPVGAQLTLGGSIAEYLGVNHLTLKVLAHQHTRLHFRYSMALHCRWEIAKADREKLTPLQEFFAQQPKTIPRRVYGIIRSPQLRRALLSRLQSDQFQVSIALNKTNMVHEPRYIDPDIIVIEDSMCKDSNREAFKDMLNNLLTDVPVLVVGPGAIDDKFTDLPPSFRILRSRKLPVQLDEYLSKHARKTEESETGVTFVPKNHALSFAHIALPARITRLHPDAAQLVLSYPLGRFGICGLDAPLFHNTLGRNLCFKVTACERHNQLSIQDFPYKVDGLLIDVRQAERRQLMNFLIDYYRNRIEASLNPRHKPAAAAPNEGSPLTPDAAEVQPRAAKTPEKPPLAAVEINPSAEDLFTESVLDRAVIGWNRISSEVKITFFTLLAFAIIFVLILFFRPSQEEQGGFITEQLRIFQERHGGAPRRDSESP